MDGTGKHLILCSFGVFASYFFYGLLQEKITKTKYGEENEKFTFILSLIFVQCIINMIVAYIATKIFDHSDGQSQIPKRLFALCSFTYIGAMFASNYSLNHVNYPTQVLGKSVKPIPVMILGVLWARKSYPWRKYIFVCMITFGVMMFMMKDTSSLSASGSVGLGFGEFLLIVSLCLDGLTGAIQDNLRSKYSVRAYDLMFNTNLWSLLYLIPAMVATSEVTPFLAFLGRHPYVTVYVLLFGATSAIGQIFIFTTITQFGPLTTSIVTTTRKFFTILASVLIFRNPMTVVQALGTVCVFAGLMLDQLYGKERKVKI